MAEYIDKAVALSIHEPPKSNRYYQLITLMMHMDKDGMMLFVALKRFQPLMLPRWYTLDGLLAPIKELSQ